MKGTAIYPSPVGDIQLDWEDGAVTALKNAARAAKADVPNELTRLVFRQLDEYFAGTRKAFDFPYRLRRFRNASGRHCGRSLMAKRAAIKTLRKPLNTRKHSGQLAWQIMQIPFLSLSHAIASLVQADRLSAMAAGWK